MKSDGAANRLALSILQLLRYPSMQFKDSGFLSLAEEKTDDLCGAEFRTVIDLLPTFEKLRPLPGQNVWSSLSL